MPDLLLIVAVDVVTATLTSLLVAEIVVRRILNRERDR